MRYSVSDTAEYGDYTRGPRIVNEQTRAEMKKILKEIQSGEFAKQWIEENKTGRHKFLAMREEARDQPIEKVGRELREMMTFLKKKKEVGVPQEAAAGDRKCQVKPAAPRTAHTHRFNRFYENLHLRYDSPGRHAGRGHLFFRG